MLVCIFLWLVGPAVSAPIVIAHRGLPSVFPDHTLAGYAAAIDAGADYVEPDLVMTRDGHPICRHEHDLTHTTDVADRFPDRRTTIVVDGVSVTGFFSEDFTLEEIRQLRAVQPLAFRPQEENGIHPVPTFEDLIALVRDKQAETGRVIGLYPETKHPAHFEALGLPMEGVVVRHLEAAGYRGASAPVFLQSFEEGSLVALGRLTEIRRIRLVDDAADLLTRRGLRRIARYADGVGVHKSHLIDDAGVANDVVTLAHQADLLVHVYTFRDEGTYLPPWCDGDPARELAAFLDLGVDGVFSDHTPGAVAEVAPRR